MRWLAVVAILLVVVCPAVAATDTWTGATDAKWSTATNWTGGVPQNGDDLVFPASGANQTNTNDLVNASFHSITISGGLYTLNGNTVRLGGGGITTTGGTGDHLIAFPIILTAAQTWHVAGAGFGTNFSGSINLNGFSLGVAATGFGANETVFNGSISGSGSITPTNAVVVFNAINITTAPVSGTDSAIIVPLGMAYLGPVSTTGAFGGALIDKSATVGPLTIAGPEGLFFAGDVPGGTVQGAFTLAGLVQYGESITSPTVYSRINVTGPVTLSNVLLSISGPVVPQGTQLTILDNQGTGSINGTFIGLPEGATVASSGSSGQNFTISYVGGTGNDIVLTAQQPITVGTTVAVTSSANPVDPSAPVTFTATVTPDSGTAVPTGTVTFVDFVVGAGGGPGTLTATVNVLGTVALNASGVATLSTLASSAPGPHGIVAIYNGGGSFGASSDSIGLLVNGTIPILDGRVLALLAVVLAAIGALTLKMK